MLECIVLAFFVLLSMSVQICDYRNFSDIAPVAVILARAMQATILHHCIRTDVLFCVVDV